MIPIQYLRVYEKNLSLAVFLVWFRYAIGQNNPLMERISNGFKSDELVMKLREQTGADMMKCKKFIIATNGDIKATITEMRKTGQAKADKKALNGL